MTEGKMTLGEKKASEEAPGYPECDKAGLTRTYDYYHGCFIDAGSVEKALRELQDKIKTLELELTRATMGLDDE